MVAAGASTRTPTPELTQAIQDARNAKAAYQQMQQAVHQMRTSVRAAGKDVGALSAAQQRYVQILAQVENRSKAVASASDQRSEEHTSELQSRGQLVCRLLI